MLAASQEEVKRVVEIAIKTLERNKINSHIIFQFIEKIISDLVLFSPMKQDAQQWSNIQMAKILFNRSANQMKASVH